MKISGIYKIQSIKSPDRCYIGSSIDIDRRWRMHINQLKDNKHHSVKLQRHFNKYGLSDLSFVVVNECEAALLISIEQFYIDSLKCYFNCSPTAGSSLGIKRTPEQVARATGKKKSKETCIKISVAKKGHKMSVEFCEKHRQYRLGYKLSEETKDKIRQKKLGVPLSEYHKKRCSEAQTGLKHGPRSEDHKKKIADSNRGKKRTEATRKLQSELKKGKPTWNKGLKTGKGQREYRIKEENICLN